MSSRKRRHHRDYGFTPWWMRDYGGLPGWALIPTGLVLVGMGIVVAYAATR